MLTVIRPRCDSEREFHFTLQCFARDEPRGRNNGRTAGYVGACTLYEVLQRHRYVD